MDISLSSEELARYDRHLLLPEIGRAGQAKLKAAKVLVVGAGGLGAPLLSYLVAAGVGTVGIVDFDTVDESNLQRQVLFTTRDVGRLKVAVAAERLQEQNPHVTIRPHPVQLTAENAPDIIREYDVVADGSDNFPTRYLVNDACVLADKVNVYAAIHRFEGQVSVFNFLEKTGQRGPNYRDLFPIPPPPELVPNCAAGGVLGVLPGIIGSLQASEVIKVLTGIGEPLSGRLFLLDTLMFETRIVKIRRNPTNPLNGTHPSQTTLIDYEQFCASTKNVSAAPEITARELQTMMQESAAFQLIDVRTPEEHATAHLGGQNIPLSQLTHRLNEIAPDQLIVVYCQSGARSRQAAQQLAAAGLARVHSLAGGLASWKALKV